MTSPSEKIPVGGYETFVHQKVVSVALFPETDLALNLPDEDTETMRLAETSKATYRGSLEIISSGSIEVALGDYEDDFRLTARLELRSDTRNPRREFKPDVRLFNLLAARAPIEDLTAERSSDANGGTRLLLRKNAVGMGDIRYSKSKDGTSSFRLSLPLTPGYEYDDIVLGANLWAMTHRAVADEYDRNPQRQSDAKTMLYAGQTGYGTASNMQIAMLGAIGKYNRDLAEDKRLGFDPNIIGANLARTEEVLPAMDYGALAAVILEAKIKRRDSSPITHGEISMAMTQHFNTHNEY